MLSFCIFLLNNSDHPVFAVICFIFLCQLPYYSALFYISFSAAISQNLAEKWANFFLSKAMELLPIALQTFPFQIFIQFFFESYYWICLYLPFKQYISNHNNLPVKHISSSLWYFWQLPERKGLKPKTMNDWLLLVYKCCLSICSFFLFSFSWKIQHCPHLLIIFNTCFNIIVFCDKLLLVSKQGMLPK